MSKIKNENLFLKHLLESYPNLNKERISIKGAGEGKPHIRFSSGCGIVNEQDFLNIFQNLNYTPIAKNEFSKAYSTGGYIKFNDKEIGVLYGIAKEGHSERKRWSPESLGLNGFVANNINTFRTKIISGLENIKESEIELFIALLNNIEHKTPVEETKFLITNKSKITSDFGEILAAFDYVSKGFAIKFSDKSNQKVVDFSVLVDNKWKDISVKNPKGGGKINLSDYVSLIEDDNGTNVHAKILKAISSHNRDDLFKFASQVSPQVLELFKIIGGTDKDTKIAYVKTHTYDEFYNQIKNNETFTIKKMPLGIPDDQGWKPSELTPRTMWSNGSTEPLDFTINTLINRFWGQVYVEEITKIVSKFRLGISFKIVDISNGNVYTKEKQFNDVKKWQTVYWSRSTKAWHNWMAVEPVKE
jgi:hypothetical protein